MPEFIGKGDPEGASSYVCALDEPQRCRLAEALGEKGWTFSEHPHAHWKATHGKLNATAYLSGKLVVQGKGTGELVLYFIEPEITGKALLGYGEADPPPAAEEPFAPHAGVDESGKGDIFGPLTVAAVFVDDVSSRIFKKIGVKDSKSIKNDVKIAFLAREIRRNSGGLYSVVSVGPEAYNRLYDKFRNLNRLLAWGHARAIENLMEKKPDLASAISDKFGHESLIRNALMDRGRRIKLIQRTKAESDVAVAAASIMARDSFVQKMKELSGKAGMHLPKGAGDGAKKCLSRLLAEKGADALPLFAKMHFKTVKELLGIPLDPPAGARADFRRRDGEGLF